MSYQKHLIQTNKTSSRNDCSMKQIQDLLQQLHSIAKWLAQNILPELCLKDDNKYFDCIIW